MYNIYIGYISEINQSNWVFHSLSICLAANVTMLFASSLEAFRFKESTFSLLILSWLLVSTRLNFTLLLLVVFLRLRFLASNWLVVHGHVLPILQSDPLDSTLLHIWLLLLLMLRRCNFGLCASRFEQGNACHIFLAPDTCTLSGDYLRHLEISIILLLVLRMNLLSHMLFEFLNANVFRLCLSTTLIAGICLLHQPCKHLLVGVCFALLVGDIITMAALLI